MKYLFLVLIFLCSCNHNVRTEYALSPEMKAWNLELKEETCGGLKAKFDKGEWDSHPCLKVRKQECERLGFWN